jgi:hypothetical protein
MYRDGSNYKSLNHVVFSGQINSDIIKDLLNEKLYEFVPSQIGLVDLQGCLGDINEDDHCWHEITGIENTDEKVDYEEEGRTIHEFVEEVMKTTFFEVKV